MRLDPAGICSGRECPAGSLPAGIPGCGTGGSLLSSLGAPAASLAPLWDSPPGIWGTIPAPTRGSAASAAPAPSPLLRGGCAPGGLWGQLLSLPPVPLAASPPRRFILSLGKGGDAKGNARDALPEGRGAGGASCACGDFGELPGAATTRPLLVPSGAAALPGATRSSGSASGDGGSDAHSVSTIWGREKARLARAASGSWVENSDRLGAGGERGLPGEAPRGARNYWGSP